MKVVKEEKGFIPVVITLETQEELDIMYYLLNISKAHLWDLERRYGQFGGLFSYTQSVKTAMWEALNDMIEGDSK